jgi:hypothetical protein
MATYEPDITNSIALKFGIFIFIILVFSVFSFFLGWIIKFILQALNYVRSTTIDAYTKLPEDDGKDSIVRAETKASMDNAPPTKEVILKIHIHDGVKIYQTSTEFYVFSTSFSTLNDAASFVNKCLNEKNSHKL